MSTPSDAPNKETAPEAKDGAPAPDQPARETANDTDRAGAAKSAAPEDAGAERTAADAASEAASGENGDDLSAFASSGEKSGWGSGTMAAIRSALGGGQKADAFAEEITKLIEENKDTKERMLRLAAEMENLRKRTEREKADTAKYAISRFAEDMLRVGDNLSRALDSVPEDTDDKDAALKSLREGIEMTSKELLNGLEKHGVVKDDPKGEVFNPNRHQAIAEMEDAETPAGAISEVFQTGYMIADRVLRPAMVVVSKGPAKEAPVEVSPVDTAANDDTPVEGGETAETQAEAGETAQPEAAPSDAVASSEETEKPAG